MNVDQHEILLEQYPITIDRWKRSRGTLICFCGNEQYTLAKTTLSNDRLDAITQWLHILDAHGFPLTDPYLQNLSHSYLTYDKYYETFALKRSYLGPECDVRRVNDMRIAAGNLGRLHQISSTISPGISEQRSEISSLYMHKKNELSTIRHYIRRKKGKGPFEYLFLHHIDDYLAQCHKALQGMSALSPLSPGWCHGDYNYHHVLNRKQGIATLHFDRFCYAYPLVDLYHFLRKVLEKNNYRFSMCQAIIEEYTAYVPLSANELGYLYTLFLFPEKFWKLSNQYMNHGKQWISPRYIDKMTEFINATQQRLAFCEKFQAFYRHI